MAIDASARRPFAPSSYDQWCELLAQTPGGSRDLVWTPDSELRIAPLHCAADLAKLAHLNTGAAALLRQARDRAVRQSIAAATPAAARRHIARSLEHGADQLLLCFDRLARAGIDPATLDERWREAGYNDFDAGTEGCAIYHVDALDAVLGDVDLGATLVAFDAGAASVAVLCMLLAVAERRGIAVADLRIELGLDPIHELVCGTPVGSDQHALLDEIRIAVGNTMEAPGMVPLAVHSRGLHQAGASAGVELGYCIATGIEYVRLLLASDSGLDIDANAACSSLCFRIQVDTELNLEIAKLRAARLLWAKVARAFGADQLQTSIHAESSLRSMARDDVHTNLLRTSVQAFAATLANCDSITLAPFDSTAGDEALAHGLALARNQQALLRDESHLHRVHDPCGGAYSLETMTEAVGRVAWEFVQEVEAEGGILAALRSGSVQRRVHAGAERRRAEVHHRRRSLIGINRFVDPRFDTHTDQPDAGESSAEQLRDQLGEFLARRDTSAVEAALAADTIDSVAAADAGCTLGEMMTVLRGDSPLSLPMPLLEASSDGAPFEQLRDLVRANGLRVQPVVVGTGKWSRARRDFARDYFAAGGFEFLAELDHVDATALRQVDADYIVLCSDDHSYPELVAQVPEDLAVVVAGRPQEQLAARVSAFIHADDDTYSTLRGLFLDSSDDERMEAER